MIEGWLYCISPRKTNLVWLNLPRFAIRKIHRHIFLCTAVQGLTEQGCCPLCAPLLIRGNRAWQIAVLWDCRAIFHTAYHFYRCHTWDFSNIVRKKFFKYHCWFFKQMCAFGDPLVQRNIDLADNSMWYVICVWHMWLDAKKAMESHMFCQQSSRLQFVPVMLVCNMQQRLLIML